MATNPCRSCQRTSSKGSPSHTSVKRSDFCYSQGLSLQNKGPRVDSITSTDSPNFMLSALLSGLILGTPVLYFEGRQDPPQHRMDLFPPAAIAPASTDRLVQKPAPIIIRSNPANGQRKGGADAFRSDSRQSLQALTCRPYDCADPPSKEDTRTATPSKFNPRSTITVLRIFLPSGRKGPHLYTGKGK